MMGHEGFQRIAIVILVSVLPCCDIICAFSLGTPSPAAKLPIFFDSSNHLHRPLSFHPEQPERIKACVEALQNGFQQQQHTPGSSIATTIDLIDVSPEGVSPYPKQHYADSVQNQPFSQQELDRARFILMKIHNPELVTGLEKRCRHSRERRIDEGKSPLGFIGMIDEDTYVTTETYDVCLRATAAWIRAVDRVVVNTHQFASSGVPQRIPTAMALTRPPGHHATANLSNGFCLFNFAAAAAVNFLEASNTGVLISILDFDVHFGQGTSDIVSKYPESVRYASIHQVPAFPYMGTKREIKHNNILTIPMTADTTWTCGYQQYFNDALDFLFDHEADWQPDLVIVSAGYDALDSDELASVSLQAQDYGKMTRALQERIHQQQSKTGKPVGLMLGMEGGYQLGSMAGGGNLQQAVLETVKALME